MKEYAPEDCLILVWFCLLLFPPLGDKPGNDDAGAAAVQIWAWGCPGADLCLERGCAGAGCGAGGSPSLTSSACFMSYTISLASCLSPTRMSSIYTSGDAHVIGMYCTCRLHCINSWILKRGWLSARNTVQIWVQLLNYAWQIDAA